MSLQKIWQRLSDSGVRPEQSFVDIKNTRLINQCVVITMFITFFYSVFLVCLSSPYLALFDFELSIQGLIAFILVRKFNYKVASVFVFVFVPAGLVMFNYVYGRQGAEYYYFPLLILFFYLYRRHWSTILFLIYLIGLFFLAKYFEMTVHPTGLAAVLSPYFYYTSFIIAFIMGLVVLRMFAFEYEAHRVEIEQNNKLLDQAAKNAKKQNEEISDLLKELNHRTKNNLQLVSSILSIQANKLTDSDAKKALEEGSNRIVSIMLLHQKLFINKNINTLSFKGYMGDLIAYLNDIYNDSDNPVEISQHIEDFEIQIDNAVTLGLIMNELITNSFKHGIVNDSQKFINIHLAIAGENQLNIVVSDSGKGIEALRLTNTTKSFGASLIHSLVKQLDGTISIGENNENKISITVALSNISDINTNVFYPQLP